MLSKKNRIKIIIVAASIFALLSLVFLFSLKKWQNNGNLQPVTQKSEHSSTSSRFFEETKTSKDVEKVNFTQDKTPFISYTLPENSKITVTDYQKERGAFSFELNDKFNMDIISFLYPSDYVYKNVTGGQPPRVEVEINKVEDFFYSQGLTEMGTVKNTRIYRAFKIDKNNKIDLYTYYAETKPGFLASEMPMFVYENPNDGTLVRFTLDSSLSEEEKEYYVAIADKVVLSLEKAE